MRPNDIRTFLPRNAALVAVALVILLCPALCRSQEGNNGTNNDMSALADVSADRAFAYLSGNFQTLHNHPAIYADSASGMIVVVGNGLRKEFPIARVAEAVKAYRNFLYDRGYEPDGKKRPKKKKSSDEEYQELLRMMSTGLSDSVKSLFTSEQLERFNDISPSAGYDFFSGFDGGYANHPVIYAHLYGFTIEGRGFKKDMPMKQASAAFAVYLSLLQGMK
jgi:hypothetical protein